MDKKYIFANIRLPIELSDDGSLYEIYNDRIVIDFEICNALPEPTTSDNKELITKLFDINKIVANDKEENDDEKKCEDDKDDDDDDDDEEADEEDEEDEETEKNEAEDFKITRQSSRNVTLRKKRERNANSNFTKRNYN